jgi:outer membrane receptor protein involved in Fe transport
MMLARLTFLVLMLAWVVGPVVEARQSAVTGLVLDSSGAPVVGAVISVEGANGSEARSGPDGRFSIAAPERTARIRVTAAGFSAASAEIGPSRNETVRIVLTPAPLTESVTVTASRGTANLETPAATSVLTSAEIINAPAGTIDDALRTTPGFTLFRRSSSRVANPTTQGVTLRGVSGSGASRTLVLADGIALNDPFGSWVYWNRIPQAAIDRVEVVRGASGDLYGADALGGVVQLLTLAPEAPRVRAIVDFGSHDTGRASVFAGGMRQGWTGTVSGEIVRTDGAYILAEDDRGAIDRPASSDYATGFLTAGYATAQWRVQGRASVYEEDRGNGTPGQINSTDWRQYAGDASGTGAGGAWVARVSGGTQSYYQTFTAVAADRNSERLTTTQQTPSEFVAASGQWSRGWGSSLVLVGGEAKRVESVGEEIRYTLAGLPTGPFPFGGAERSTAIFGRVSISPLSRLTLVAGGRTDSWTSEPDDARLPTHDATFFSPRGSVSWQIDDQVAIQGSVYRAHRTPTLNELHRGFRVGNVQTNPNPLLDPETLTGFEGGVLFAGRAVSARVTGFVNYLDKAITNITIATTPALITRERQNADKVRAAGVELEADYRPVPSVTITGLAAFTSSVFRDSVAQPQLSGNRVPQVPSWQFGAGLAYAAPDTLTATVTARAVGPQYDDDLNAFKLDPFFVMDASASRAIGPRGLHVFAAIENIFDVEYDVGRTPIRTIGWPRTVRAGVRVFLP